MKNKSDPPTWAGGPAAGESLSLQDQADCWMLELETMPASPELKRQFQAWLAQSSLHQQAWQKAQRDWHQTQPQFRHMAQPLARPHPAVSAGRRWFLGAGLGAVAGAAAWGLAPAGLGIRTWQNLRADHRTDTGEQKLVQLSPTVTVQLNTQSALRVSHDQDRFALELLSGELAMRAEHQLCELRSQQALLSFFNSEIELRQIAAQHSVLHCREGWVNIFWQGRQHELKAGQVAHLKQGQAWLPQAAQVQSSSWRQGMLVFHEEPLLQVIEEVNRYRPGRVVLLNQDYAQRRFSANLHIAQLDQFIEQLEVQPDWNVRRLGDYVFVS